MEKAIERLDFYLGTNKCTYREIEQKAGLSSGYLSNQVRNKTSIGADVIAKICEVLPNLNPAWLVTGKGEPDLRNLRLHNQPTDTIGHSDNKVAHFAAGQLDMIDVMPMGDKEKAQKFRDVARQLITYTQDLHRENKLLQQTINQIVSKSNT